MAEIYLGGAATDTRAYTTISPLGIVVSGTAATDVAQLSNMVLMDINVPANMVTADNTMIVTGATGAVAGGIKIRINGTDWWIMLASADQ
jgi:predicted ATP-dependent Lon-type protease